MNAVRYPIKGTDDYQIYICKSKSIKGKKKREKIESYKSAKALGNSKEEIDLFIKNRIAILEKEENERKDNKKIIEINPLEKIEDSTNLSKNSGFLFLQRIWYELKLESFFNKWKFDNELKIKYSLNDAMRLMCFSRIIFPGSKLYTAKKYDSYIESFDITSDDLYDTLDRIPLFQDKLTRKLSKICNENMKVNDEAVFYDCTNFYFDIQNEDDENGLRAYGVEKNHRSDPIVEYGILMTDSGWPIGSTTFRGNESEKTSLKQLLINAGEEATASKIICADAGLNTTSNKQLIHNTGRNYIFSQGVKGLSKDIRKWAINGQDMITYGNPNSNGEYKSYKSRWFIRSNGLNEKIIVKFDPASKAFILKTIEKRIEHAQAIIKKPNALTFKNCQDGKQYIQKITMNKNGEIIVDKSILQLNMEMINNEKEEAGYYCLVTDIPSEKEFNIEEINELKKNNLRYSPKSNIEIIEISGKRTLIEDCFRVMKSGMDGRPIFVRTKEHIIGHLFTVYIALVLITYMKKKYKIDFSNESLFSSLRSFSLITLDEGTYQTIYMDENIKYLREKFEFCELKYKYLFEKDIRNLISKSKIR